MSSERDKCDDLLLVTAVPPCTNGDTRNPPGRRTPLRLPGQPEPLLARMRPPLRPVHVSRTDSGYDTAPTLASQECQKQTQALFGSG